MDCIDCKATNPDSNNYCGQCGAELGRSLEETVRKKGFRDRYATEMEITEAVVGRLMRWAAWLGTIATVIVVLFGLLLGKSYMDVCKAVNTGKTEINTVIQQGFKDISGVRQKINGLNTKAIKLDSDYAKLDSNIAKYNKATSEISKLQKDLKEVKGTILNLTGAGAKAGAGTLTVQGTHVEDKPKTNRTDAIVKPGSAGSGGGVH